MNIICKLRSWIWRPLRRELMQHAGALHAGTREELRASVEASGDRIARLEAAVAGLATREDITRIADGLERLRSIEAMAVAGRLDVSIALDHAISEISRLQADIEARLARADVGSEARFRDLASHVDRSGAAAALRLRELGATLDLVARAQIPRRGRPIRVLFLVHLVQAWDSLADVHAAMVDDPDFEPIVASLPRRHPACTAFGGEADVHEGLEAAGVPHLRFSMADSWEALAIVKAIAPDVIFRQSPWDADLPPAFHTGELGFARLCYVPYYGLQITERHARGAQTVDLHSDSPFHRACWRIFCEGEDIRREHRATAVLQGMNVVATGHPKLARLARAAREPGVWPIGRGADRPRAFRLVWAPHHAIGDGWLDFGTFDRTHRDMLNWAGEASDIDFVLRPHPLLFDGIRVSGGAAAEALDRFIADWNALPNTAIDDLSDYARLFAASDALVTDGVSFIVTYQFFDKPLVFIERPDHVPFNALGERAVSSVERVADVEAARRLVDGWRSGHAEDRFAAARTTFVRSLLPASDPAAAILGAIRSGLGEPAPSAPNH